MVWSQDLERLSPPPPRESDAGRPSQSGIDQVCVGAGADVEAVGGIAVGEEAPDVGAGAGGVVGAVAGAPVGDAPVSRVGVVDTW